MDEMLSEISQLQWTAADQTCSECEITVVYNLPCRHVIRSYAERNCPIPLEVIDPHWRKLRFDAESTVEGEDDIEEHIMALRRKYDETHDRILKANLKAQIELLCDPSKTTAREPEVRPRRRNTSSSRGEKVAKYSTQRDPSAFEYTQAYKDEQAEKRRSYSNPKTKYDPSPPLPPRYSAYEKQKGKGLLQSTTHVPKSFKYLRQIPALFHEHILEVNDVVGDGHCGFRVVAKAMKMGFGENDWGKLRKDLQYEIENFPFYYYYILGQFQDFDSMRDSLIWDDTINQPPLDKWMSVPEAGYLIASRYNIALVMLHIGDGLATYLPMHSSPPANPIMIVMAHVNTNHFVEIIVDQSKKIFRPFPMPPIINGWDEHHGPEAAPWQEVYRQNFRFYEALIKKARPHNYSERINVTDNQ